MRTSRAHIKKCRSRPLAPLRELQTPRSFRVVGEYGRTVIGSAKQKYLNAADTVALHKRGGWLPAR